MIWTTQPRSEGAGALRYFQAGDGPPLVLIHGVGLQADAWLAMVPALSRKFRVVCVDMPGHGASPWQNTTTLGEYSARLTQFLAELPIPVFIAGHSMGALLALELAAQHPRKIAGVGALNGVYRRSPQATKAVCARAEALAQSSAADPEPTLERWFGAAPHGDLEKAADACRGWLSANDISGYAAAYRVFAEQDGPADATLMKLNCPAVFITGSEDPNSTAQMSQSMASLCKQGHAEIITGAAHMMPMTHADSVAAALFASFSKSTPCRSAAAPQL